VWNFPKILFLLTRYGGIILGVAGLLPILLSGSLPQFTCYVVGGAVFAGSALLLVTVQIILQYRVYIIYGQSRKLLLVNGILCFLEIAAGAAVYSLNGFRFTRVPDLVFTIGACYVLRAQAYGATMSPVLAFEVYLGVLAMIKAYQERQKFSEFGETECPSRSH